MKKIIGLFLFVILCSCASTGKSNIVKLDTAIQQASKEINDSLPAGTKVALLNFSSDSDIFSDYVIEEMSIALVKRKKLAVIARREINLIRSEMNFQMSGDVSDEYAQQIGMMLGAQSIVSGSFINIGETYSFRTKTINVISAAIETSSSINVSEDSQIKYMLSQSKKTPTPSAISQVQPQVIPTQNLPAASVLPALQTYKIGDTGPAGGLIFYDKENNNNGWRYLEAAPLEAEFQAVWSVRGTNVENTQEIIGSGKRNTQLIVETFSKTSGEWDTAAQKADDMVFNGFDDWFLPSQAELDQMYGNLKRKNLGDFKNESYWTSTQSNTWNYTSTQNFKDGQISSGGGPGYTGNSTDRRYVRPIRQVPGPAGTARSEAENLNSAASLAKKPGKGITILDVILVLGGAAIIGYLVYVAITGITGLNLALTY